MSISELIAKHVRDVLFGGNWTAVNLRGQLVGVSWEVATERVDGFHTIAELAYYIHYFVVVQLKVLRCGALEGHDKFSFDVPEIRSAEDWGALLARVWGDVAALAEEVECMGEERLGEVFCDEKYGTYWRNLVGLIEHTHYH